MNVAKRLQYFLDRKELTANALSKQTDVSQTMISGILRGDRNPTVITLELICNALNITLEEFFSDDTEMSFELKQLLNSAKNLTTEQISILNDFIKTIKN